MGIISDLRKRRLFQIVVAYLAAGFVVLQGVDQLVQHALLPPFAYPLTLWWYGVGTVAAVVIGWFHGEKGVQTAPLSEIVILGVLGVFLLGITGTRVYSHVSDRAALVAAAASELDLRTIAVTYFQDLNPDGANEYVADALTEDLIQSLSTVRALDVISRNGVLPFRGTETPVDRIARELRAGTVVSGSVEEVGSRIRVNVRLHDGQSGTEFRRVTLERPVSELLEAREEVAEETARFLREWLGEEIQLRRRGLDTDNLAAWRLVQRAERERKEAERLVREAHDLEGAFAAMDEADELLARAERLEPRWAEPVALRAAIAYRRSRIVQAAGSPQAAEPWIRTALEHADRALVLEPTHAQALELRGTTRYFWHLLPLIPDPAERRALLTQARADVERAVRLDPTLASAHSTLSHLYAYVHEWDESILAGRRAYEEDAYLETADVVLWRLVTGYYDQETFDQSLRWCDEGARRLPGDFRFAQCQLLLMTTRAAAPDVERAWRLFARVDSLVPEAQRAPQRARTMAYVGGVLARANLPDSADAVLRRAREEARPEVDPRREILLDEANMRANAMGDVEGALELLTRFAATHPTFDFSEAWQWRSVRAHPRYQELLALQDGRH